LQQYPLKLEKLGGILRVGDEFLQGNFPMNNLHECLESKQDNRGKEYYIKYYLLKTFELCFFLKREGELEVRAGLKY
jgi:hypothetical protein